MAMTGKQLRDSVLQMAVQGRLVEQDPNDEPASALLERVREERRELVKKGEAKAPKGGESVIYVGADGQHYELKVDAKGKRSQPVSIENEVPFMLPDNWQWARTTSVVTVVSAKRVHKEDWKTSGVPFYRAREVTRLSQGLDLLDPIYISEELYQQYKEFGKAEPGDLLVSSVGTLGDSYIVKESDRFYYKDTSVLCFKRSSAIRADYLNLLMQTPLIRNQIEEQSVGTTVGTITRRTLAKYLLPIPPLAEQERIVAKLDELLPMVDRYGDTEAERIELDERLPSRLRESLLQAAVQGRLTEQDPDDEPASFLLDRIRKERATLIKSGELKAPKGGESVIWQTGDGRWMETSAGKGKKPDVTKDITDEVPFDLPEGWTWTRLESVLSVHTGLSYRKENLHARIEEPVRVLRGGNITRSGTVEYRDDDVVIDKRFVADDLHLEHDDLLTPAVTSLENVGKIALVEDDPSDTVVGGFVFFLRSYTASDVFSKYLWVALSSPEHIAYCRSVLKKSGQAFYNLSKRSLSQALIPIPPLAEQERIVAKLDELLPMVDAMAH